MKYVNIHTFCGHFYNIFWSVSLGLCEDTVAWIFKISEFNIVKFNIVNLQKVCILLYNVINVIDFVSNKFLLLNDNSV